VRLGNISRFVSSNSLSMAGRTGGGGGGEKKREGRVGEYTSFQLVQQTGLLKRCLGSLMGMSPAIGVRKGPNTH